jgi:CHAD domain-containing protein
VHRQLFEITTAVEAAADHLSERYTAKSLYALRVGVRRIRSILKHIDSHRSRNYRKAWGGFAATTNDARDWDVFLETAGKLLGKEGKKDFRAENAAVIGASHEAVIEMLESAPWQRHLGEWKQYLGQSEEDVSGSGHLGASLDRAMAKALRTLERALAADEDRLWHKFRIAVKGVRYVADTGADDPDNGEFMTRISSQCRVLQTLLGDWHDTVVQLDILDERPPSDVHRELQSLILARKQRFLTDLRRHLAGQPLFG